MALADLIPQLQAEQDRCLMDANKIAEVIRALGGMDQSSTSTTTNRRTTTSGTGRRPLSAAARARIVAAQRARWARYHAKKNHAVVSESDVKPRKKRKGLRPA